MKMLPTSASDDLRSHCSSSGFKHPALFNRKNAGPRSAIGRVPDS